MKVYMRTFWNDTQGQDMVEYALVAALVSVADVATLPAMRNKVSNVFSKITNTLALSVHYTRYSYVVWVTRGGFGVYVLVSVLVSVASVATLPVMCNTVSNVFSKITNTLAVAVP